MALLQLPDELIIRIAENVLDIGWEYDISHWFDGDIYSLRDFLLVHPRIYALCKHLRVEMLHDFPISSDDRDSDEELFRGVTCIRQGQQTLKMKMDVDSCCDINHFVGIPCIHPVNADSKLAKTISDLRGVSAIDLTFYSSNVVTHDTVATPQAHAALFSLPSILYITAHFRYGSHLNLLGQWLSMTKNPRALLIQHDHHDHHGHQDAQPDESFWTSIVGRQSLFSLDLRLDKVRAPLVPPGARESPLAVAPWHQLQYLCLQEVGHVLTEYLLEQVCASLVASASTLKVIHLPLRMFSAVTQATIFPALRYLTLDSLEESALDIANRAMSFQSLEVLELVGPAGAAAGASLVRSRADVPVLQTISLCAADLEYDSSIETLMAICREHQIRLQM